MKTLKNNLKSIWLNHKAENKNKFIVDTDYLNGTSCDYTLRTDLVLMYRILLIKLNEGDCNFQESLEEFNGVNIVFIKNEIHFILKQEELLEVFELLCNESIEETKELKSIQEVYERLVEITTKWRALFSKLRNEGLAPERQKGLLGELILIDRLIDAKIPYLEILKAWKGPDYSDKDFRFSNLFIEVKFTTSILPRIKISSEHQLSSQSQDPKLILLNIKSEITNGSELSLNGIIYKLKYIFKKHSDQSLRLFEELLEKYGYLEIHERYYKTEYSIKSLNYYHVDENFPKITGLNLPEGIFQVTYSIENAGIVDFQIEEDFVIETLNYGSGL